jgi:hypothetical protein
MRAKLIAVVILIAVILVSMAYSFRLFSLPDFTPHHKIGEEIKGFPVDELSITFTDYTITKSLEEEVPTLQTNLQSSKYVIFMVTVKNLASHELYFNRQDDFNDKLTLAKVYSFVLTYGERDYDAFPIIITYPTSVPSTTIIGGSEIKVIASIGDGE